MMFAPAASSRFDQWFSRELAALADEVCAAVGPSFVGLVLGGGYGRGEGGVVVRNGVERPYNDVDLLLFVEQPRRARTERLAAVAARYHERLGVEVDISRPYRPREMRHWHPTLMWHELLAGHRVLRGPATLLEAHCPPRVRQHPPPGEALRLLLNRGAGLLWALRIARGLEPAPDADFVRRNYFKCALACGDALLLASGLYGTFASREVTLAELPVRDRLHHARLWLYRQARTFKLRPDALPDAAPDEQALTALASVWGASLLAVERRRTGQAWDSLDDWSAWTGVREADAHTHAARARRLASGLVRGRLAWSHPREALHRELPGLLGLTRAATPGWDAASAAFLERWRAAH